MGRAGGTAVPIQVPQTLRVTDNRNKDRPSAHNRQEAQVCVHRGPLRPPSWRRVGLPQGRRLSSLPITVGSDLHPQAPRSCLELHALASSTPAASHLPWDSHSPPGAPFLLCRAVGLAGALLTVNTAHPHPPGSPDAAAHVCGSPGKTGDAATPCRPPTGGVSPRLTLQVHLVQLSTTHVSFSAKKRPSCQQADMFLVLGGPPMSSQRNWLSLDWKVEGNISVSTNTTYPLIISRPRKIAPP